MKKGMFGAAVLVALAGCDDGVRLEAFDGSKHGLELNASPDASSVTVRLYGGTQEDWCPTISSSVRAELNGMPLRLTQRGGERSLSLLSGYCVNPTFTLDVSADPSLSTALKAPATTLRVSDGERTWVAEVEFLCNRRSLRVISPASGVLHRGERVEVELDPATDTFFQIPNDIDDTGIFAILSPVDKSQTDYITSNVELAGNRLRFTVPHISPPLDGPWVLEVTTFQGAAPFRRHVSRCEGFSNCKFDCGHDLGGVTTPVRLSPL
jgi:hypothetical protein